MFNLWRFRGVGDDGFDIGERGRGWDEGAGMIFIVGAPAGREREAMGISESESSSMANLSRKAISSSESAKSESVSGCCSSSEGSTLR